MNEIFPNAKLQQFKCHTLKNNEELRIADLEEIKLEYDIFS